MIIRRMIRFPADVDPTLRFKVAETKEELEQAFAILHNAYVRDGLMKPQVSGLRVTKFHALPSTTTLIAVENGTVVGTVSLVRRNSFGLPLESIFSIEHIGNTNRVVEVSSLAIKNGMQKQRGRLLFPLLRFMFHYSTEYFGVSHFVIAVSPKWWDFYQSVLLFKPLSQKIVESYEFVNGVAAVGGILNLKDAFREYLQTYGGRPLNSNLFHFFTAPPSANMEFPMRKRGLIWDPVLTPELMKYFFIDKTDTFNSLSEFELSILRELYHTEEYRELIPLPKVTRIRMRKEKRFEARLFGRILGTNGQSVPIEIHNVGMHSLDGIIHGKISEGTLRIRVDIEDFKGCQIDGSMLRSSPSGSFVALIPAPTTAWKHFIENLDTRLLKEEQTGDSKQVRAKKV